MRHEAENAFGQLSLTDEERKDFDKVGQAFDSYFQPNMNTIHERCAFDERVQVEVEPTPAKAKHTSEHCMLWQRDVVLDKIKTRTFFVEM